MKIHTKYISLFLFLLVALVSNTSCTDEKTYVEYVHQPSLTAERVGEMASSELTVSIVPNEFTQQVRFALGTAADEASFLEGSLEHIQEQAGNASFSHTFTELDVDQEYIFYAQAYGVEEMKSKLIKLTLSTAKDDFKVELKSVSVRSASIHMESSSNYYLYVYGVGHPEDLEAFKALALPGTEGMQEKTSFTANFYHLEPDTDYTLFVMAVNRQNQFTEVQQIPIRTLSAEEYPTVIKSKFTVNDLITTNYDLEVNEACHKIGLLIVPKGSMNAMINTNWNGNILDMMTSWADYNRLTVIRRGPIINDNMQTVGLFLDPNPFEVPYDVFILLYDQDKQPYAVEHLSYVTPPFNPTLPEAQVHVSITDVTKRGATYNFNPDSYTLGYIFETFDADWYDEATESGELTERQILEYMMNNFRYGSAPVTHIERTAEHPNQRLYLLMAPINHNGFVNGMGKTQVIEYTTANN